MKIFKVILALTLLTLTGVLPGGAQGTAFTYLGHLNEGSQPANGSYDLRFSLFGAAAGGSPIAGPQTNAAVAVTNGAFMVTLDFGNSFTGADRWLEIGVRTNGGAAFALLEPRQRITPTPYAIYAGNAANAGSLAGQPASAFAPASGSSAYVAKTGDTMTGTLRLPANGLAVGTSQLLVSNVSNVDGRLAVGIGTATPQATLHLSEFLNGRSVQALLENTGPFSAASVRLKTPASGSDWTLAAQETGGGAADGFFIHNGQLGAPLFIQAGSGKVGLGTTTPATTLDVNGTVTAISLSSSQTLSSNLTSRSAGESLAVKAANGTGNGGGLSLTAGDAGSGAGGGGGNLTLRAGNAVPLGGSGYANQGPAGAVTINAGGGYNGVGGNVTIRSGDNSPWSLTGNGYSKVALQGGTLNGNDGAVLEVEGAHNPLSNGSAVSSGGQVKISAGNGVGGYAGGDIILTPGLPSGKVQVNGTITATSFNGSGAGISNLVVQAANLVGTLNTAQIPALDASKISSGTISDSLLSANVARQSYGAFALAGNPNLGVHTASLAPADVNGDGKLDLFAGSGLASSVLVLTNDGSGNLWSNAAYSTTAGFAYSIASADVNGDGRKDVISANYNAGSLTIRTNNGSGVFVLAGVLPVDGIYTRAVLATDINGDGDADLISANYFGFAALTVKTNNGSGGFTTASNPGVGNGAIALAAADVNGDGAVDVISANAADSTLTVLTNRGGGQFGFSSAPAVGLSPGAVTAADINGDGKPDLISANAATNTLSVLTNNGTGGFVLAATLIVGSGPAGVVASDINLDAKMDVISADYGTNTLTLFTNNGSGGLVLFRKLTVGGGAAALLSADVSGDGKLDLIAANTITSTLSVLFNTPLIEGTFVGSGSGLTGIGTASIAPGSITTALLADGAVTLPKLAPRAVGTNVAAGGVAMSLSSSNFTFTSTVEIDITNLTVTITTTGRPVMIGLFPDGLTNGYVRAYDSSGVNAEVNLALTRNAQVVGRTTVHGTGPSTDSNIFVPSGAVQFIDLPGAGTHTYKLRGNVLSGDNGYVIHSRLVAYEL